ncbi:MAG: phosphate ABC transporter permease PstA [Abitibacteriaceae bacterium]|nr:phosphate ABC transporter permease PstA [Abditibacteriaceae bacterium]
MEQTAPLTIAPQSALRSQNRLRQTRRRLANAGMWIGASLATIIALVPLLMILYYVTAQGLPALNADFFTKLPKPVGETGGGMAHAIVGSFILIGLASLIGLPLGVLGGIYLAEFGNNRFGWTVRFAADVLNGIPSIVIGIFVYAVAVRPVHHFSAMSGGLALGIMMIPTIMRTTEELVRLVPMSLREAALALGATRWRAVLKIVLGAAKGGVITGILLAIARIAGETAPLLFTAFGNRFFSVKLNEPMSSLPREIYTFAISPYEDWHQKAWGGSLVLVLIILVLSLVARYFTRGRYKAVR